MNSGNTGKVIAAGAIGNVLEWYDFAIYGYFATQIGRTFFPSESPVAQVLAAFGIFAVGYLMRPIGGAVVGQMGDRLGRRTALTVSVIAMAVPSFLVGILPGYAVLGVAAPLLLTLLRMLQGLSVGGEYTTSIVFMVENAPPHRRGLVGALACCGAVSGILLGSATGAVLGAVMSPEVLTEWGWRVPFLMGLVIGAAGMVLRRMVDEGAPGKDAQHAGFMATVSGNLPLLARLAGLSVFNAVGFYLLFVYIVSWIQMADKLPAALALEINTASMAALVTVAVVMGYIGDYLSRRILLLCATGLGFAGALPLFWLMHHPDPTMVLMGQMGFVLCVGMFLGSQPTLMVESTPPAVRCTAIALGYNVTLGLIGGMGPLAATWLVSATQNPLSPAFLVMAAAAVSFVSVLSFRAPPPSPPLAPIRAR